jgi:hypothetical protein
VYATEVFLESRCADVLEEIQRMPQQVQTRPVFDDEFARRRQVHRHATEDEFREQPVAALLQVAAIRHLGHQVCRSDQVAEATILLVADVDLFVADLVTRVVHDLARDARGGAETGLAHVAVDELCAAADVAQRELGAVEMALVRGVADIARVVQQDGYQADGRTARAELSGNRFGFLVTLDETRQRQDAVERVLDVMVDSVAAEVAGHTAVEKIVEVLERTSQRLPGCAGVEARKNVVDGFSHRLSGADLNRIGHVMVATSEPQRYDAPSPLAFAVHKTGV